MRPLKAASGVARRMVCRVCVLFGTSFTRTQHYPSPFMDSSRAAVVIRGPDPETQWVSLRNEVARRGFRTYRRYVERGPLMLDVRRGELAAILVLKLSDFAQSTRDLLCALEEFKKYNVRFISVREGIDTSTMGDFFLTIVAALVECEHTIRRERILEGLDRAHRQGKRLGRRPSKGSDHPAFSETRDELTLQFSASDSIRELSEVPEREFTENVRSSNPR
jgi:Resolvase, N terminal domain